MNSSTSPQLARNTVSTYSQCPRLFSNILYEINRLPFDSYLQKFYYEKMIFRKHFIKYLSESILLLLCKLIVIVLYIISFPSMQLIFYMFPVALMCLVQYLYMSIKSGMFPTLFNFTNFFYLFVLIIAERVLKYSTKSQSSLFLCIVLSIFSFINLKLLGHLGGINPLIILKSSSLFLSILFTFIQN